MLDYYKKHPDHNKYKCDHTCSIWIDVGCIMSTMTMSHNVTNEVYTIDKIDAEELENFVTEKNV